VLGPRSRLIASVAALHSKPYTHPGTVAPKRLIPIHTFEREKFPSIFENVSIYDDGEWIEVGHSEA
jgi:hypothetical protein